MLEKYGLKRGELPESYNILHPEIIEKIHEEYLDAGSRCYNHKYIWCK